MVGRLYIKTDQFASFQKGFLYLYLKHASYLSFSLCVGFTLLHHSLFLSVVANRAMANSIAVRICKRRALQTRGVKKWNLRNLEKVRRRWAGILRWIKVDRAVRANLLWLHWQWSVWLRASRATVCTGPLWQRGLALANCFAHVWFGKINLAKVHSREPKRKAGGWSGQDEGMKEGLD